MTDKAAAERENNAARAIFKVLKPANMIDADWDSGAVLGAGNEFRTSMIEAARAVLKALPAPTEAQGGWKRVPVELTDDMLVAFAEVWYSKKRVIDDCEMADCYAAMLSAAPDAPTQEQGDGLSPVYAWLERSTRNSPPDVANAARTMMAFYQGAEFPEVQGEDSARQEWKRITAPGQVKVGDKLRFTIGDEPFSERVKQIINPGYPDEELIYNKRRNFYVITSNAITNFGSSKNVEFLARASAETGGVKS